MRRGKDYHTIEMVLQLIRVVFFYLTSCLSVVLSEALTDMTVANSNPPVDRNSSSRQETSRQGVQAAGSESPRGE